MEFAPALRDGWECWDESFPGRRFAPAWAILGHSLGEGFVGVVSLLRVPARCVCAVGGYCVCGWRRETADLVLAGECLRG